MLEEFGITWTNPLAEEDRKGSFLKSELFKHLVFGLNHEPKRSCEQEAASREASSWDAANLATDTGINGVSTTHVDRPGVHGAPERR